MKMSNLKIGDSLSLIFKIVIILKITLKSIETSLTNMSKVAGERGFELTFII